MDLEHASQCAARAAEEAGQLLLSLYGSRDYQTKEDGSLQTVADVETEALLRDRLTKAIPGAGFLGEESTGLSPTGGLLWVCDPLDGTTNYVNGLPLWGISIALLEDLTPLVGIVHLPFWGETISAVQGKGALCDGERVRVRVASGGHFSDIYTFCSYRSNKFVCNLPGNVRAFGSTVYHIAQFVRGRTVGGWEMGAKVWDIAAGILLVQEAGGIVRSTEGKDLLDVLEEEEDLRLPTFSCMFASSQTVYELMYEDMVRSHADYVL